jgi:hypothetical protein
MEHSIAAKFAARPAAQFVHPSSRARQRRLGLRPTGSFSPSPSGQTVLRTADLGPYVRLLASWRAVRPARTQPVAGPPRPGVAMHWARSGRSGSVRRSSAAPAPWRA